MQDCDIKVLFSGDNLEHRNGGADGWNNLYVLRRECLTLSEYEMPSSDDPAARPNEPRGALLSVAGRRPHKDAAVGVEGQGQLADISPRPLEPRSVRPRSDSVEVSE